MTQRERQVLRLIEENPMISQQELADQLNITRSSAAVHISNLMKKGYIAGKGYVLRSNSYAAVVGGINVDIGGKSNAPLIPEDSNPGRVSTSLGGVGRNIAHNMSLMGCQVRMLSAIGDDVYGRRVAASCSDLGIDITKVRVLEDETTSTYLYITGPDGDMALAVSDMGICSRIDRPYLQENLPLLQNAQLIVADTNIPEDSLRFLAEKCSAPLFCDPVSTTKAEKLRGILPHIHTLKPNRIEAGLLSGLPVDTMEDVAKAADKLLELGVHRVFISLGGEGIYAAMGEERIHLPNFPGNMVNTTGCGDSAMAAVCWAYLQGLDLETTAKAALAAGAITMESPMTICPDMSEEALLSRMGLTEEILNQ